MVREAEIMDIVNGFDKDLLRMFTFDKNIYFLVLFKCETIIFYGSFFILHCTIMNYL